MPPKLVVNQRQIEAFRVVILRGTMTAAAEELRTSQPTISRLIAELEAATGLTLFSRVGSRLQATDMGVAFYREVELSFIGLDKLTQTAREIAQFGTGRLRIAAAPVLALGILPCVIARFKQTYPSVMVALEMRSEPTIRRWVSSGYCDLGFPTAMPETVGVNAELVYEAAGVCALPATHALVEKKKLVARDLSGVSLILPSYADTTRSELDRALHQAGIEQVPSIETPYGATICALVGQGAGVGIVNPLAALAYGNIDIVYRPFTPDILFAGYAVYPDGQDSHPLAQAFAQMVRDDIDARLTNKAWLSA